MASARQSDEETCSKSGSGSDISDESDSDGNSEAEDVEADCQLYGKEPCKYYNNKGVCRNGDSCSYLHFCKYALTGSCRHGSKCRLNHPGDGRETSGAGNRERSSSSGPKLTDGRCYQWQLNDGQSWTDVDNDHILEAQYSLPHTKSIKIYNTPYGAVSIDFKGMRVHERKKNLRVRRLDDGNTQWIWYCTLGRKWIKYGDKDPKGQPSPVKNSDIEQKFQSNPTSSYTFTIGAETFEIRFRDMRQVTSKRKRTVTRRPVYRQQPGGAGVSQAASTLQNLSLGTKPQWQFEGDTGAWHVFKRRSGTSAECSVTSDDIERKYQQNPRDSMTFKVNGRSYKLDLGAMTQTNLKNKHSRKIRRVLV